jgi:hypothetical protein
VSLVNSYWRHYKAAALAGIVLLVLIIVVIAGLRDSAVIVSLAGVAVSLIYFFQSQRLEETRLFKDLFSEFNLRYDKLNGTLLSVEHCRPDQCLTDEMNQALVDYFNLCDEEYMFYKLGYIREEAWRAWLNGMRYYYKNPRIRELWEEELEQDSYYGFTAEYLHPKLQEETTRPTKGSEANRSRQGAKVDQDDDCGSP